MKWRRTGKNTNLYRSLCSTSDFSIVTDSRFFVDFVRPVWYDKDAGRAVLQTTVFPLLGQKLFLASWFFEKTPVERCAAAWRGLFYVFSSINSKSLGILLTRIRLLRFL
jgi:hypothetical protein